MTAMATFGMAITEAQAVVVLLAWLADSPSHTVTDAEAIEAMELLADHAGRRLQLSPDRSLPARIVERLQAAESDGAAQALCRQLDRFGPRPRHGGRNVYVSVQTWMALDEWRRLQGGRS